MAENIRKSVAAKKLVKKGSTDYFGNITMWMGVTSYQPGETAAVLIDRADKVLYLAKKFGRNRVMCVDDRQPAAARA